MSESTESHAAVHAPAADPFTPQDLKGFVADDQEAGRGICKMLSLFFFYTVIVMGLSTYVTYRWVVSG
jgi:hypothetical protein